VLPIHYEDEGEEEGGGGEEVDLKGNLMTGLGKRPVAAVRKIEEPQPHPVEIKDL